ncbi:Protein of unknown function [Bacillus wiedmannii]|uniref:Uncharacterized protein n=1 Tax=Bacillus wiedmannii TaxID=1890302 RepID=A0AB37YMB9_9BACI|nr:Protein of unknown function [Bacillus wiedmannii]
MGEKVKIDMKYVE